MAAVYRAAVAGVPGAGLGEHAVQRPEAGSHGSVPGGLGGRPGEACTVDALVATDRAGKAA